MYFCYTLQESVAEGFLEAVSRPSGFFSLMESLIPQLVSYFSKAASSLVCSLWLHSTSTTAQCVKKYLPLVSSKRAHVTAAEVLHHNKQCIIAPFTLSTALHPHTSSAVCVDGDSSKPPCSMFLMSLLHHSEL